MAVIKSSGEKKERQLRGGKGYLSYTCRSPWPIAEGSQGRAQEECEGETVEECSLLIGSRLASFLYSPDHPFKDGTFHGGLDRPT